MTEDKLELGVALRERDLKPLVLLITKSDLPEVAVTLAATAGWLLTFRRVLIVSTAPAAASR
jgi:hypothetical protein